MAETRDQIQARFESVHGRLAECGQFGIQRDLIDMHLAWSNYSSRLEQRIVELGGTIDISTAHGIAIVESSQERARESAAGTSDLTPTRQG